MQKPIPWVTAALVAATLGLSGCAAEADAAEGADPAVAVEEADGSGVSRLTLSDLGARRLGVVTEPVTAAPGGGVLIPYSAIVYQADGTAWAYANPSGRTYVREPVEIASIDGATVHASSGPVVGTAVVTVGVAELVGAEVGLGH